MIQAKLLDAQDTLHTARSILALCEEKASSLAENTALFSADQKYSEAIGSIARALEVSRKLILEAVETVDDAHNAIMYGSVE